MTRRTFAPVERGAAMTEFVVLCIAMVPLMFGIPMIGKLIDVKHTAVQASRYAAWESTVYAGRPAPRHVRERFFGDASAPISSGGSDAGHNALWGGEAGFPARLRTAESGEGGPGALAFPGIADGTRVTIDDHSIATMPYTSAYTSYEGHAPSEGLAEELGEAISAAGDVGAGLFGGDWPLEGNGLLRGGVRVDTAPNGWLDTLSFEESAVIMSDGWSAPSEDGAEARVRSLVPAGGLERTGIGEVLSAAGLLPGYQELRPLDDAFGHVDMGELPTSEMGERDLGAYEEER